MSRFKSTSSNPFDDEDDYNNPFNEKSRSYDHRDDKRHRLQRQVDESEDRQLESTQRAIASLYESEAMGNATAEELLRQREVIQNMERKTDNINTTLTTSQRHINNIKSVFGGIKNWWNNKKENSNPAPAEERKNTLDTLVAKNAENGSTSGWEGQGDRSLGGRSAYQSDADLDSRFMAGAMHSSDSDRMLSASGRSSLHYVQPITQSAREEELDRNLGLMSDGLGRLKMLAQGLGEEIDEQNEALDRLNPKVNTANDLLESQNKQMGRILKR